MTLELSKGHVHRRALVWSLARWMWKARRDSRRGAHATPSLATTTRRDFAGRRRTYDYPLLTDVDISAE